MNEATFLGHVREIERLGNYARESLNHASQIPDLGHLFRANAAHFNQYAGTYAAELGWASVLPIQQRRAA